MSRHHVHTYETICLQERPWRTCCQPLSTPNGGSVRWLEMEEQYTVQHWKVSLWLIETTLKNRVCVCVSIVLVLKKKERWVIIPKCMLCSWCVIEHQRQLGKVWRDRAQTLRDPLLTHPSCLLVLCQHGGGGGNRISHWLGRYSTSTLPPAALYNQAGHPQRLSITIVSYLGFCV